MTDHTDGALLVFTRAPVAGQVKSRLVPVLGTARAARLQALLLEHALEVTTRAGYGAVELWLDGHPAALEAAIATELPVHVQCGADIGARMAHAFADALRRHARVVLIGTDCPGLTPALLARAHARLRCGDDAVLGPVLDGGYALIGLCQPMPALFCDVPWGSAEVMAVTRARLAAWRYDWTELMTQFDVDRPRDLARLVRLAAAAPPASALGRIGRILALQAQ